MTTPVSFHEHLLYAESGTVDEVSCATTSPTISRCRLCGETVPADRMRYRCDPCTSDFCRACVLHHQPTGKVLAHLAHRHPLYLCTADSRWICHGRLLPGGCRRPVASVGPVTPAAGGGRQTGAVPEERFRCALCDVDLCLWCVAECTPGTILTDIHQHPLSPYDCDNGWCCDASDLPSGCRRGIGRFFQSFGTPRFRCHVCDFDLCDLDAFAHKRDPTVKANTPTRHTSSRPVLMKTVKMPALTNGALVQAMSKAGLIKTPGVLQAFRCVDRAMFLPAGHRDPYSGTHECDDPRFVLKPSPLYAECLESLCAGYDPSMSFLTVPAGPGYLVCLAACIFSRGVACGIDMREPTVEYARERSRAWSAQQSQRRAVAGSEPSPATAVEVGEIEYMVGNAFLLDRGENVFDRILVDVECTAQSVEPLLDYLKIGGILLATSAHKQVVLFVRESATLVKRSVLKTSTSPAVKASQLLLLPLPSSNAMDLNGDLKTSSSSAQGAELLSFCSRKVRHHLPIPPALSPVLANYQSLTVPTLPRSLSASASPRQRPREPPPSNPQEVILMPVIQTSSPQGSPEDAQESGRRRFKMSEPVISLRTEKGDMRELRAAKNEGYVAFRTQVMAAPSPPEPTTPYSAVDMSRSTPTSEHVRSPSLAQYSSYSVSREPSQPQLSKSSGISSPALSESSVEVPSTLSDCNTIHELLELLGLSKYADIFVHEDISLATLSLLSDDDLKSLGLGLGPRKILAAALDKMAQERNEAELAQTSKVVETTAPLSLLLAAVPVRPIGGGSFGTVWRGVWNGTTPVAMKTLNGDLAKHDLLVEIELLSKLRHPNIIQCYGAARHQGLLYMVTELAEGSVLDLLHDHGSSIPLGSLLGMALSCAAGMNYLAQMHVVHRDLACRNLLYFTEGSSYLVKISDLGLAKCAASGYYTVRGPGSIPVKWTALEALAYRRFTTMSDIWSFGVVLWEVFSGGVEPYAGVQPAEIFHMLKKGGRLRQPERCPDSIYTLMTACWLDEPTERPSFSKLFESIKTVACGLEGSSEYHSSVNEWSLDESAPPESVAPAAPFSTNCTTIAATVCPTSALPSSAASCTHTGAGSSASSTVKFVGVSVKGIPTPSYSNLALRQSQLLPPLLPAKTQAVSDDWLPPQPAALPPRPDQAITPPFSPPPQLLDVPRPFSTTPPVIVTVTRSESPSPRQTPPRSATYGPCIANDEDCTALATPDRGPLPSVLFRS